MNPCHECDCGSLAEEGCPDCHQHPVELQEGPDQGLGGADERRNLGAASSTPCQKLCPVRPAPRLQPGHHQEGPDEDGQEGHQGHRDWARINDSCNLCRFIASFLANI